VLRQGGGGYVVVAAELVRDGRADGDSRADDNGILSKRRYFARFLKQSQLQSNKAWYDPAVSVLRTGPGILLIKNLI
jgi:hypothetical protein